MLRGLVMGQVESGNKSYMKEWKLIWYMTNHMSRALVKKNHSPICITMHKVVPRPELPENYVSSSFYTIIHQIVPFSM